LVKIFEIKKFNIITTLVLIGLAVCFYFFNPGQIKANPGTVEFTADTILSLTGLPAGQVYIGSGSKCDSLTVSGTDLSVNAIFANPSYFLLKTTAHTILKITPSLGTVNLAFSSAYFSSGYVNQWVENSSVSVAHLIGVPKANTFYVVKVNSGVAYGTFNSGALAEVSFTRTGGGAQETFTITESTGCQNHNVWGWAWSNMAQNPGGQEGIGWISFSCTNCDSNKDGISDNGNYSQCPVGQTVVSYGVDINPGGDFTGFAWSENVGWIDFAPAGPYPSVPNYSAKADMATGQVSGWARACAVFQAGCSGALKGDSERGGWDGWIKLRKGPGDGGANYGLYIDGSGDLQNWAWGSDVAGWISFNCANQGCGASNYKVHTNLNFNAPPSAINLSVDPDNSEYCGKVYPPVRVRWQFSDAGDSQSAYQLQVDTEPSFSAPLVVDTGKLSDNCLGDCAEYVFQNSGEQLAWNTNYYWRIMVWDSSDLASDWASTTFNTIRYPYPFVDFTKSPASPKANTVITFSNNSTCYPPGGCQSYSWDFGNGYSSSNPVATTTYTSAGLKTVSLTVNDGSHQCTEEKKVVIGMAVPQWQETAPIMWLRRLLASIFTFTPGF
jgi:hypothetical protein